LRGIRTASEHAPACSLIIAAGGPQETDLSESTEEESYIPLQRLKPNSGGNVVSVPLISKSYPHVHIREKG
jgi:hypothetical protein